MKILGVGELKKKLVVEISAVSAQAREKTADYRDFGSESRARQDYSDEQVSAETERMGRAARERVQRIFQWDQAAAEMIEVFEEVVNASHRRSRAA